MSPENKLCNTFGYINHENELIYLTSITQGIHLTYSKLLQIDARLEATHGSQNPGGARQGKGKNQHQNAPLEAALFDKDGKVKFQIVNGALQLVDTRQ